MSATWTAFGAGSFCCRDGMLGVWWAVLVDEIDHRPDLGRGGDGWLARLGERLRAEALVRFDGISTTRLDAQVQTDRQRRIVLALASSARARLDASGMQLDLGPLASRVGGARLAGEAGLRSLRRVADAFLWLLGEGRRRGPGGEELRQRFLCVRRGAEPA